MQRHMPRGQKDLVCKSIRQGAKTQMMTLQKVLLPLSTCAKVYSTCLTVHQSVNSFDFCLEQHNNSRQIFLRECLIATQACSGRLDIQLHWCVMRFLADACQLSVKCSLTLLC